MRQPYVIYNTIAKKYFRALLQNQVRWCIINKLDKNLLFGEYRGRFKKRN